MLEAHDDAHRKNHYQYADSNTPLRNKHSRLGNSLLTLLGNKETTRYKKFETH
jgi:hypothetical protein